MGDNPEALQNGGRRGSLENLTIGLGELGNTMGRRLSEALVGGSQSASIAPSENSNIDVSIKVIDETPKFGLLAKNILNFKDAGIWSVLCIACTSFFISIVGGMIISKSGIASNYSKNLNYFSVCL